MEQGGVSERLFNKEIIPSIRKRSWQLPYSDISIERPGWSKLLILAGASTTIGLSQTVGYNLGVVNTPAEVIKKFCNDTIFNRYGQYPGKYQLDLIWSFIVSMFLVGGAVGSLGGSYLADKIGRKGVLILCTVFQILSAILFLVSKPSGLMELLFVGRLLSGFASGLTTTVVPMYLIELAPLHLRGAIGVLCPLGLTIGVLAGQILSMHNILGNTNYWPHCLAVYAVPVILTALILPILPESPKYLFVIKKQHHLAFQQLKRIRKTGENSIRLEIEELKKEQVNNEKSTADNWNLRRVLTDRSLLLPLLLVCSLQGGQQLSGINAVFFYSNRIFIAAGLSVEEREMATIGTGICNCLMAILSIWTMSRFTRRLCIQVSLLTSAVCLITLGVSIMYIELYPWVAFLSIVGVLGFVLCYGIGLGPIPYFVGSELFEVGPRPTAMALGSMCNWGGNLIVGLTFPTLQLTIGSASFFIFAAVVLGLFVFLRAYLPETKGKDISEIVQLCSPGLALSTLEANAEESSQEIEKLNKVDA
ncbi:solute carrier family 2, facilitated glucose transporter member 1-like isoform X1 [Diorhabda sublineata]|uniref:solute carrier family 2, facilitated glucose transporter member 1-like isoform X1 n=1 Tax=Diorhabda sublineata TaxID=1163346 RepID=UPI0024E14BEB|nr:solute carrier family 2, facilitated glucose transporter member 1-like isoform X1 [Diorhabda sublineata]